MSLYVLLREVMSWCQPGRERGRNNPGEKPIFNLSEFLRFQKVMVYLSGMWKRINSRILKEDF
jgi:hypothetical protein